jgi:hypothetical protein
VRGKGGNEEKEKEEKDLVIHQLTLIRYPNLTSFDEVDPLVRHRGVLQDGGVWWWE